MVGSVGGAKDARLDYSLEPDSGVLSLDVEVPSLPVQKSRLEYTEVPSKASASALRVAGKGSHGRATSG